MKNEYVPVPPTEPPAEAPRKAATAVEPPSEKVVVAIEPDPKDGDK